MCNHDTIGPSLYRLFEWYQFNCFKPLYSIWNDWQGKVRVNGSITMTGEMLEAGENTGSTIATYHRHAETSNHLWVFTERAHPNHRIGRIIVHIHHRGKIHVDTEGLQFAARCQGNIIRDLCGTDRAQRHVAGENSRVLPERRTMPFSWSIITSNGWRCPASFAMRCNEVVSSCTCCAV